MTESRDIEDEELTRLIHRVLKEASDREYIPLNQRSILGRELFNAFRKLDLLQEFLEDDEVTEIMINGTQNIFLEKGGHIFASDRHFEEHGVDIDKLLFKADQWATKRGGRSPRGAKQFIDHVEGCIKRGKEW